MKTSQPIDVEQLLAAAGIDFTVVEHCPHPSCELCHSSDVSAAA